MHCGLVLHYFGSGDSRPTGDIEVVNYGYRSRGEAIAMMAKWDLALLPYPTEEKFAETVRLSFPDSMTHSSMRWRVT